MKIFVSKTSILIVSFMLLCPCLSAQDTIPAGKALNIPLKKYGISIGNSREFTGIRINFTDRYVKKINGLNITLWPDNTQSFRQWSQGEASYGSDINGISVGVFPLAGSMGIINIGLLGVAATPYDLNGLSVGGVATGAAGSINGISISGLLTQSAYIKGIAVSGLMLAGTRGINGMVFGGLIVSSDIADINGFAASAGMIYCGRDFKGIGISGIFLNAVQFKGVAISGFARTDQMNGLSVALFNRSNNLHGIQLGLLNYAGNNRKGLRMLPLINMHFGKTRA